MKIKSVVAAAALAAMLPFIALQAQAADPVSAADKETTRDVKAALQDSNLKKEHLRVKTTGSGDVLVSGRVKNMAEVYQAMNTARAVNGVEDAKVSGTFYVDHLPPVGTTGAQ